MLPHLVVAALVTAGFFGGGGVRPVGGDWMTVRQDGGAYLDVRTTFETHDGAAILVTYQGLVDLGEHGYDAFLRAKIERSTPILALGGGVVPR